MPVEEDFARFKRERPQYEQLVVEIKKRAEAACRAAGLRCSVLGRAKALDSFVKKLLMKPQPYDDVFDKAGVRIVAAYPDDRDALAAVVRSSFHVSWEKDFIVDLEPNRFEYRGLHLTVGLRGDDRAGVPQVLWPLVCELQVHRPGESVWASVSHDLFYKSRLAVDSEARRSMNRLSALLELADISMADIRRHLLRGPGAEVGRIIDAIEKDFLRLTGRGFNERLTLEIVEALRPLVGDVDGFLRAHEQFIEKNKDKLLYVFDEYKDDFRHLLMGQPESLIIFYLMEVDRAGLEERWPPLVPASMLDGLGDVWAPAE